MEDNGQSKLRLPSHATEVLNAKEGDKSHQFNRVRVGEPTRRVAGGGVGELALDTAHGSKINFCSARPNLNEQHNSSNTSP